MQMNAMGAPNVCHTPSIRIICVCCDRPRENNAFLCACKVDTTCLFCMKCFRHCACVTLGRFLKESRNLKIALPMCRSHERWMRCGKCEVCVSGRLKTIVARMQELLLRVAVEDGVRGTVLALAISEALDKHVAHELSQSPPEPTWNSSNHPRNIPPLKYF